MEINFDAKKMTINDGSQEITTLDNTQNKVSIHNSAETHGIKASNGRGYQLNFPVADESVGFLNDERGNLLYTISRKDFITKEDVYKLK